MRKKGLGLSLECQHLMALEDEDASTKGKRMEKLGAGGKLGVGSLLKNLVRNWKREC